MWLLHNLCGFFAVQFYLGEEKNNRKLRLLYKNTIKTVVSFYCMIETLMVFTDTLVQWFYRLLTLLALSS